MFFKPMELSGEHWE